MDYGQLEAGIKYFEKKWPPDRDSKGKYSTARQKDEEEPGYWLHLERMKEKQLAKDIIRGFLNPWKCRIPARTDEQLDKAGANLKQAVDQLPTYYASLAGFRIEDIDFQGSVTLKHEEEPIRAVINQIYSVFLRIETKFGRVAASKLMHMALPDLFVMWDDGIIQSHCIPTERLPGIKQKARSYVGFLILMQENVRHVIESYPQTSHLTPPQVAQALKTVHRDLPLPRLLDMANMAVRDCEQAICITCMKKAKARWATLGLVNTNDSMNEDPAD